MDGDDKKMGSEDGAVDENSLPEGMRPGDDGAKPKKSEAKPEPEQKLVRVRINGKTYELPEDAAEDLLAEQDAGRKRAAAKQPEKKEPEKKDTGADDDLKDIETLIFTNPREAFTRFGKSLAQQITGSLRNEYGRDQAQAAFWRDFYETEGKHLKKADKIVRAVMNDNMDVLATLTVNQAKKTLADLTDKELQTILGEGYKPGAKADKTDVEGSAKTSKKPEKKEEEPSLGSLSQIVKRRQEARRKATFSRGGNEAA